jgi:hypothetical protein
MARDYPQGVRQTEAGQEQLLLTSDQDKNYHALGETEDRCYPPGANPPVIRRRPDGSVEIDYR